MLSVGPLVELLYIKKNPLFYIVVLTNVCATSSILIGQEYASEYTSFLKEITDSLNKNLMKYLYAKKYVHIMFHNKTSKGKHKLHWLDL